MDQALSEYRNLFKHLKDSGKWDEVRRQMLENVATELNGVKTPDQAFRVAVKYELIQTALTHIENNFTNQ